MATCDVLTDLLLVIFPIPIIVGSTMSVRRKIQLVLLFSLSLSVVCVTLYRVPHIFEHHGRQQYRSLLASIELLFATAAANALVLGSFVRDRGLKKQKFRRNSNADSFDRSSGPRRPTMHRHWGSDEDLVRDVGLAVEPELRQIAEQPDDQFGGTASLAPTNTNDRKRSNEAASDDVLLPHNQLSKIESLPGPKKMAFFDVGGLLDDSVGTSSASYRRGSYTSTIDPHSLHPAPSPTVPASSSGLRRGSAALLQDLGGLLGPLNSRSSRTKSRTGTELQPIPQAGQEHNGGSRRNNPVLMDPGGLLK